jgi:hypothetical protein
MLLKRIHVLMFTEHGTRRTHPGGVTANPAGDWTAQQARNPALTPGKQLDAIFQAAGTTILRTAVQAPRINAICQRLAGTPRRELPDRVQIPGQAHPRAIPARYQVHHNTARPHQGTAQRIPDSGSDTHPATETNTDTRQIRRKPVLNSLINQYAPAARRPEDLQASPRNPIFERDRIADFSRHIWWRVQTVVVAAAVVMLAACRADAETLVFPIEQPVAPVADAPTGLRWNRGGPTLRGRQIVIEAVLAVMRANRRADAGTSGWEVEQPVALITNGPAGLRGKVEIDSAVAQPVEEAGAVVMLAACRADAEKGVLRPEQAVALVATAPAKLGS